jgi:vancomycin resistance protein YoaR
VRGKVVAAALAATLATAGVGAAALVVLGDREALPGTTVAGTAVGGLDREALRAAVERLAAARTTGTLTVRAGGQEAEVDRSLAVVDVEATVEDALEAGRGGLVGTVLGPLLGAAGGQTGRPVALVVDVDEPALEARLSEIAARIDEQPYPGGIDVRGTTVSAQPPRPGRVLDRVATAPRVADALQIGQSDPLDLPVVEQSPPTSAADVQRVVRQARRALGGPYALTRGEQSLQVTPFEVSPLLRTVLADGRLELRVDLPGLNDLVAQKAQAIDRPAVEAGFDIVGAPPVVDDKDDMSWTPQPAEVRATPGATGLAVDVDPATARLSELILAAERDLQRELPVSVVEPELTTQEAQTAGVSSLIGTFTTYFTAGQPRATNIRRIAEIVDEAYVAPGETFSLNGTAGQRTRARGFVADGAIVDGELTDEVGGGVSQFATTLFNAAFFAGLDIEEYQPHSFYISRYPAGRESTVYWQQIDVKFLNDTSHGIVVETSSTPGSVTVALYGDNGGRLVTASHGPRRPRGDGGFRIEVTRTTTGGDGVGGRRVFRTSYDPAPEG